MNMQCGTPLILCTQIEIQSLLGIRNLIQAHYSYYLTPAWSKWHIKKYI